MPRWRHAIADKALAGTDQDGDLADLLRASSPWRWRHISRLAAHVLNSFLTLAARRSACR